MHSQHSPWDPAKLASDHAAGLPAKQTTAKRAADALLKTQAQVIKQQRTMAAAQRSSGDASDSSDGSPSANTSRGAGAAETGAATVETSTAEELQARAVGQQAALRHAKINAKPRFSRQLRDQIVELYSLQARAVGQHKPHHGRMVELGRFGRFFSRFLAVKHRIGAYDGLLCSHVVPSVR